MDTTSKSSSFSAPSASVARASVKTLLLTRREVERPLSPGEFIAGIKPGRSDDDEIILFDSTGTALQDVAAAAAVYRRALGQQLGVHFSFNA